MFSGQCIERINIRSLGTARHADQLQTVQAKIPKQVVIARVVNQYFISGGQHATDYQVERLTCPGGEQNLRGIGGDTDLGQNRLGNLLA